MLGHAAAQGLGAALPLGLCPRAEALAPKTFAVVLVLALVLVQALVQVLVKYKYIASASSSAAAVGSPTAGPAKTAGHVRPGVIPRGSLRCTQPVRYTQPELLTSQGRGRAPCSSSLGAA